MHPAIVESCAWAIDDVVSDSVVGDGLVDAAVGDVDLLGRFAWISDGRSDQIRDHPVAVVLTLCVARVLAGMRLFTAIAGWIADVLTGLLARLYGALPSSCPPTATNGPRVMASLRNLAGRRDITEATRWASRFMHRAFDLLGLTT